MHVLCLTVYFLKLVKILNGTADEIEHAIVTYLQEAYLKYLALIVMEQLS